MNPQNKYRKPTFQKKIDQLQKQNSRFSRIYSEYEHLSNDLWEKENLNDQMIPDDFLNAIIEQTNYLEIEIEEWLKDTPDIIDN